MKTLIASFVGIAASSFVYLACDDSNAVVENADAGASSSSGQTTSGKDDAGGPKDCFDPPFTTHLQIINACTNADKIERHPQLSKLLADGGVPKP